MCISCTFEGCLQMAIEMMISNNLPTYVCTYHYNKVVARSINYGNGVMTFLQTSHHAVARVEYDCKSNFIFSHLQKEKWPFLALKFEKYSSPQKTLYFYEEPFSLPAALPYFYSRAEKRLDLILIEQRLHVIFSWRQSVKVLTTHVW